MRRPLWRTLRPVSHIFILLSFSRGNETSAVKDIETTYLSRMSRTSFRWKWDVRCEGHWDIPDAFPQKGKEVEMRRPLWRTLRHKTQVISDWEILRGNETSAVKDIETSLTNVVSLLSISGNETSAVKDIETSDFNLHFSWVVPWKWDVRCEGHWDSKLNLALLQSCSVEMRRPLWRTLRLTK